MELSCILAYLRRESVQTIPMHCLYKNSNKSVSVRKRKIKHISKIQLVVYYQSYVLGWATTRVYVIAH